MLTCLEKMKIRWFLLGILYVAGTIAQSTPKVKICQQQIITHINYRYATTVVTTRLTNTDSKEQEYTFSYLFPNEAFLTGFEIEVNYNNYSSYVLENEDARKQFKSIGSLDPSKLSDNDQVRNSQKFSIPINLEAHSMVTVYLTYEELLIRNHGQYEHIINIFPGQLVEDLFVEIFLKENRNIVDLKVANLRSGFEIENNDTKLEPQALIWEDHNSEVVKSAKILFIANEDEQKKFALSMKTKENLGLACQFVIQYDLKNNNEFGEIVVGNNYFVVFFAPKELEPLPKHIVFVMDTSGSMKGERIDQFKKAMAQMLNQLQEKDLMNIVEFNSDVKVWDLKSLKGVSYKTNQDLKKMEFPKPFLATPANIKKAIDYVNKLPADGSTNILSPLKVGLQLMSQGKNVDKIERQSVIMFLTDGNPTAGETSFQRIIDQVTEFNNGSRKSSISTLSFGKDTNKDFLQSLATLNMGYYKHIYDAKDSQTQIENFFNTISVPVLSDINFKLDSFMKYTTLTKFNAYYDGSELIVAGQYDDKKSFKPPVIEALGTKGPLEKQSLKVYNSTTDISHTWAFITTKQLLSKIKTDSPQNTKKYQKEVLDVSLNYSFVTQFSPMVIVKPNQKFVLGTADVTTKVTAEVTTKNTTAKSKRIYFTSGNQHAEFDIKT